MLHPPVVILFKAECVSAPAFFVYWQHFLFHSLITSGIFPTSRENRKHNRRRTFHHYTSTVWQDDLFCSVHQNEIL